MKRGWKKVSRILLWTLWAVTCLSCIAVTFFMFADFAALGGVRRIPAYEREEIGTLVKKTVWTEDDYRTLYYQTGLSKTALDQLKAEPERILPFQDALFYGGETEQESLAPITSHDRMKNYSAPLAPLEDGDVIVTSSCHTFGWRNGHAVLVVNGESGRILEAFTIGQNSTFSDTAWMQSAANFIVLRLKNKSAEERAEIARWAEAHLYDVPYSVMAGVFSEKYQGDEQKMTHCANLVWQAYMHFGYDIDSTGGAVVTARNIANSPLMEVVQFNGFDADKLWK